MSVTNVRVVFSRKVKPADYEGADASVEISAVVEEGQEYEVVLNQISAAAKNKVLQLVGLAKPATPNAGTAGGATGGTPSPTPAPATAAPAPAPEKTTRPRRPKAEAATTAGVEPASASGSAVATAVVETPATEPSADDIFAATEPAKPAKVISDVELNAAVQDAHKKLKAKNPSAGAELREAAKKYIGEGKPLTVSNIPQESRQAYLDDLAKIAG